MLVLQSKSSDGALLNIPYPFFPFQYSYVKLFGSSADDAILGIAADSDGDVYAGGYTSGSGYFTGTTLTFGAITLGATTTLHVVGSQDVFVTKLDGATGSVL